MSRKIVVAGNCQSGGVAGTLQEMLPHDLIIASPWPGGDEALAAIGHRADGADVILTSADDPMNDRLVADWGVRRETLIKLPSLLFFGFHPDTSVAYVDGRAIDGVNGADYQSVIGLWAFKNGFSSQDAARLFTPETYRHLGFSTAWAPSVKRLRKLFDDTPWSFADFLLPLQASGQVFMHTINHPTIGALTQLSRVIARHLGAEEAAVQQPVERYIPDGLMGTVWPVYPGIADHLGRRPDRIWKIDGQIYDLKSYLTAQFDQLGRQTGPIDCHESDNAAFDAAMRAIAFR